MNETTAIKVIEILTNRIKDIEMMRDFYDSKYAEASAENEKLLKRIAELEARNADLESLLDRMEKRGILKMEEVNDD